MKILVNIEAQKSSDSGKLGYHLENRIVFYLARMISAQKQTEFFHSDFDNLKKVRSIWICMDSSETEDSIEEIGFDRKTVFGNKKDSYHMDLMKGIIVNIRNGGSNHSGEVRKKSQNVLIVMLEELVSMKDAEEKKRILAEEYGMIMRRSFPNWRLLFVLEKINKKVSSTLFHDNPVDKRVKRILCPNNT